MFELQRHRVTALVLTVVCAGALAGCSTSAAPAGGATGSFGVAGPTTNAPGAATSGPQRQDIAPPVTQAQGTDRPVNCVRKLRECGDPDASSTGWRHTGVQPVSAEAGLTAEREFTITTPGAVVDGKDIAACVNITADNVVIKRSRVRCDSHFPIRVYEGVRNALIEDTEIDGLGSGTTNAAVGFDSYTLRRVDIHHVGEGPHMGVSVHIEDSYVHDLANCDVCHNDAVQSPGAANVALRHNTFINDAAGRNAVVRIATEQGDSHDFLVQDNLLAGGGRELLYRLEPARPLVSGAGQLRHCRARTPA